MSITDIAVVVYLIIGLFLSIKAVTSNEFAIEFCNCSFISLMFIGFSLLLAWPLCIAIYIDHTRRLKRNKILNNILEVSRNIKLEHDEQLATFIDGLSKRYPEVSFAKLSRIAVAVSRWEVERITKIAEEELKRADRCKDLSDATAEQKEYTFWDGYEACAEYLLGNIKPPKS